MKQQEKNNLLHTKGTPKDYQQIFQQKCCRVEESGTIFKVLEGKKTKPKVSRKVNKDGVKINEIETKKTTENINKISNWLFKKINKIDKPLARLTEKERERERGLIYKTKVKEETTTDTTDTKDDKRLL